MAQAIKYQSTEIASTKSATQIATLIQKYGGTRFEQRWGRRGVLTGVRFAIKTQMYGEVPVRLTARTATIYKILSDKTAWDEERCHMQADRIAWRQLKDFVEQALFAVETGLFDLAEAFMAHVETYDGNEVVTIGELFRRHGAVLEPGGALMLNPGEVVEAELLEE